MSTYTWNASDYAQHSAAQQTWARELLQKLALQGHETVLDIGCGDGKVTAEIATHLTTGAIAGIDSSAAMIDLAQQHYARTEPPLITFQVADAQALPAEFRDRFTTVFSNAVLHWVPDHLAVLQGIKRSLQPGGKVLLQMGGKGCGAEIFAIAQRLIQTPPWAAYFTDFQFPYHFHAPADYLPWLEAAGLRPLRVELLAKDMTHPDAAGLAGWIRTTWLPFLHHIPPAQQETWIDAVVSHYLSEHPPSADGQTHVPMTRLEVEAGKD